MYGTGISRTGELLDIAVQLRDHPEERRLVLLQRGAYRPGAGQDQGVFGQPPRHGRGDRGAGAGQRGQALRQGPRPGRPGRRLCLLELPARPEPAPRRPHHQGGGQAEHPTSRWMTTDGADGGGAPAQGAYSAVPGRGGCGKAGHPGVPPIGPETRGPGERPGFLSSSRPRTPGGPRRKALYLLEYRNYSKRELTEKIARTAASREAAQAAAGRMEELGPHRRPALWGGLCQRAVFPEGVRGPAGGPGAAAQGPGPGAGAGAGGEVRQPGTEREEHPAGAGEEIPRLAGGREGTAQGFCRPAAAGLLYQEVCGRPWARTRTGSRAPADFA